MNNTILPILFLILALVLIFGTGSLYRVIRSGWRRFNACMVRTLQNQAKCDLFYQVHFSRMKAEERRQAADYQARAEAELAKRVKNIRPRPYDPDEMKPRKWGDLADMLGNEDDITNENFKS